MNDVFCEVTLWPRLETGSMLILEQPEPAESQMLHHGLDGVVGFWPVAVFSLCSPFMIVIPVTELFVVYETTRNSEHTSPV